MMMVMMIVILIMKMIGGMKCPMLQAAKAEIQEGTLFRYCLIWINKSSSMNKKRNTRRRNQEHDHDGQAAVETVVTEAL